MFGSRPLPSCFTSFCISANCFSTPVHVGRAGAAAERDPAAAAGLDELRLSSLLRRHRVDDRLDALQLPVVDGLLRGARHLAGAGDQLQDLADRPHLLDLAQLAAEVLQREARLHHALRDALGFLLVDGLLRALDQRQDVAHAQDALGEAIGVERLQAVGALAGADEADRQAGDAADAERRATTGVAVHLGQHQSGDRQPMVERLGHLHGLLAGHGVDDQQRLGWRHRAGDAHQLVHHRLVHVQPAGGVEQHDVHARAGGPPPRRSARPPAPACRPGACGPRSPTWSPSCDQLVDRGRAVDVGGHEQRLAAVLAQAHRQLGGGRRLAGSLQADQHDHRAACRPALS